MARSRRRTSKFWLAVTLLVSFGSLIGCIYQGLETLGCGITVMIPAVYTAYVSVGHMDLRQTLSYGEPSSPDYTAGLVPLPHS